MTKNVCALLKMSSKNSGHMKIQSSDAMKIKCKEGKWGSGGKKNSLQGHKIEKIAHSYLAKGTTENLNSILLIQAFSFKWNHLYIDIHLRKYV